MITFNETNKVLTLQTKNTTYLMQVNEQNHLEHIYYGARIDEVKNINDMKLKYD